MLGTSVVILAANLSAPGYLKFAVPFLIHPWWILSHTKESLDGANLKFDELIVNSENKSYQGIRLNGINQKCIDNIPVTYHGFTDSQLHQLKSAEVIGNWSAERVNEVLGEALCLSADNKAIYVQNNSKAYLEITYDDSNKVKGYIYQQISSKD